MASDRRAFAGAYVVAWVIASAMSAYYTFLRAPAVVAVRPQLAEVGFWTAAFSGRFVPWLFYTSPLVGTLLVFGFWTLVATAVTVTS